MFAIRDDDPGFRIFFPSWIQTSTTTTKRRKNINMLSYFYLQCTSIFITKICYQALKNIGWDPGYAKNLSRISNTVKILCAIPCMSDIKSVNPTLYRKFETYLPRNETVRPGSNFTIHLSVSDLYIPTIGLIGNLYFPVYCVRELSAQRQERRVHINNQRTNFENYGS
jgi:hypothetical protein